MRKNMLCIYCLLISLFVSGCSKKEVQYNFMYDQSEVSKIEIVIVGEEDEQGLNRQEVRGEIEDIDLFLDKFNQITCYKHVGDPRGVYVNDRVIKVTYVNGEYELIGRDGQARYTMQRQYVNYVGYRYFDKEEFYDLINYYLEVC